MEPKVPLSLKGLEQIRFGLGRGKVRQIVIQWPSGLKQTLRNVSANQEITVIEAE
jgi:hypothetical protein